MPRISVVADVKPRLGESPVWDAAAQRLYFVDSLGARVFRCTEHGSEMRAWTVPAAIGSLVLRASGGAVVALATGIHALDFDTGAVTPIVDPEPDKPGNRLNDSKVDARGRCVCASMDTGEAAPSGALWSLDAEHRLTRLADGLICGNGPCWSPDGGTLYYADSFRGVITACDYDLATGAVANPRVFARVDGSRGGAPDGATVDADGYLWSATVFDGRIVRYDPAGAVERAIEMPVCKITSLTFGGPNLDRLFVTSMAEPPLPRYPGDGPLRGSLFAVDGLGVTGREEPRFAG